MGKICQDKIDYYEGYLINEEVTYYFNYDECAKEQERKHDEPYKST